MAVSSGDSCLLLDDLDENGDKTDVGIIRQMLFDSGVVATPDLPGNCPLVLDGENRLYLHRYFGYEQTLAECLVRLCQPREIDTKLLRPLLDSLFSQNKSDKTPDWQKMATALALRQSLLIISGGPGTGKTTTVASLLACILETSPANRSCWLPHREGGQTDAGFDFATIGSFSSSHAASPSRKKRLPFTGCSALPIICRMPVTTGAIPFPVRR